MKNTIKILGHRGYSGKFTENSHKAFEGAIDCGAQGVEMDVQKTKDSKFVIFHDSDLNRMTGGRMPGKISDYTYEQLINTPLDDQGQNIVCFEEFLEKMPASFFLDIELKMDTITTGDCPALYELILRYRHPETFIISSFDEKLLYYFKKRNIKIGLLMSEKYRGPRIITYPLVVFSLKPDFLNLCVLMFEVAGAFMSRFFIKFFKFFGYSFMFWTVNTEEEYKLIADYADYIITNEVELIQRLQNTD